MAKLLGCTKNMTGTNSSESILKQGLVGSEMKQKTGCESKTE
jgi:hypothetical protein